MTPWLALGIAVVITVAFVWTASRLYETDQKESVGCSREPSPFDSEDEVRAALELHEIRRRIEVAQARAGIRRDADDLRRRLNEELAQLDRRRP